MRFIITYIFLFGAFSILSQPILPAFKDGSWWLVEGNRTSKVEAHVSYIDLFDQKGYAFFIEKGLYGIMNSSGETILNAEYSKIEGLNNGYFVLFQPKGNALYNVTNRQVIVDSIRDYQKLNEQYATVLRDTTRSLIHLNTGKVFEYQSNYPLIKLSNVTVVNQLDSVIQLYDKDGVQASYNRDSLSRHGTYSLLRLENEIRLFYSNDERVFTKNNTHIEVRNGHLSYYDGKRAHLIDLEEREEIIVLPYEKIRKAWKGGYNVYKNGLMGWVNADLQLKIPIQYSSIENVGSGFYVTKNGFLGFYDKNYQLILDCIYENFFGIEDDFIYTYSRMGQGLYSMKSHKHILTPAYYSIRKNGNVIKAYRNRNVRTIVLNAQHKVVSDVMLEDVITANQIHVDTMPEFDKRILQQGWYYEAKPVHDTLGRLVDYRFKWGIKNAEDSVLLKPRYSRVNYLNGMPINIASMRPEKFMLWTGEETRVHTYDIVDYQKARKVTTHHLLEIDTLDGDTHAYSRFETIEGHYLFYALDDIRKVNYFGNGYGTHIRYCKDGKRELVKEDKKREAVNIAHYSLNGRGENTSLRKPGTQELYHLQKFENGKWNFLTPLGKDLFEQPFEFVDDFYRGNALVKRKSGWGIATKFEDSLLLNCDFASIQRVELFEDTLFLVRKNQGGNYYMNGKGERVFHDLTSFVKGQGDINMINAGNQKVLMFKDQELERSPKNYLILNNNYYAKKEDKAYTIYSTTKTAIWNTKEKPVKVLSDNLIMVRQGAKNAIYSDAGDTIVQMNKINVQSFPIGILVTDNSGQQLISHEGQLIYQSKKDQKLLIDETLQEYATLKNGKIVQYNVHNEKLFATKIPDSKEIRVISGRIILDGKLLGNCNCNKDFANVEEVVYYGEGFFGIEAKQDSFLLYFPEEESPRLLIGKKLKYHGDGVFSYRTKTGLVVMNEDTTVLFPKGKEVVSFQDGKGLIRFEQGYQFYTQNLRPLWDQYFRNATPFKSGYATIYEQEGWTIIDEQGVRSTYGSFTQIEQIGSGLFQCTKKPLYGLYDNHGTQVLPTIYESIRFVNRDIVQVIKDGEVGYYSIKGASIFKL